MGISCIILKCTCCNYKGHVHVILADSKHGMAAVCARCFNFIQYVGKNTIKNDNDCCYCERQMPKLHKTREHLIPQSAGGSDHPNNIRMCCASCNQWRGNKPYIQWAREVERFISFGKAPHYQPRHISNILKNTEQLQTFIINHLNDLYL